MTTDSKLVEIHRAWLGPLQPVGLTVSAPALERAGFVPVARPVEEQQRILEVVAGLGEAAAAGATEPYVPDPVRLFEHVLGWRASDLLGPGGAGDMPDELAVPLPAYGDVLRATWALRDPSAPGRTLLLIQELPLGQELDDAPEAPDSGGWHASPEARFERLLSESGVRVGLLINGSSIRLVYVPEHQTAGHLTFPVKAMTEVPGRAILAAFHMLLGEAALINTPPGRSLHEVLALSREYQNEVSNLLAEQVLGALWELLQGFAEADRTAGGSLLAARTPEELEHVYGGLLTTLMRLVFLLYAEDQGLLPSDPVWVANYSVAGLAKRLTDDRAANPDTMDQRYGAWATLLALFRVVFHGGGHGGLRLPARKGQLFDPDAYPFLEGRARDTRHDREERIDPPLITDGCIQRVLEGLLVLKGERLSYRSLDVEQIGSVYEAMMGYVVERMDGPSLALKFSRKGSPGFVFFDVGALLAAPPRERAKWLKTCALIDLPASAAKAVREASSAEGVLAALDRRVSPRTPRVLPPGSLVLQPGEERRRSGSHYTPRSLTKPIVVTTLEPVLAGLSPDPTPDQILDLKVCDPAMGSGAFLVEACRQLAERLVSAWERHGGHPPIPPDETPLLHAKRLVAQRCLYGVDKNPFAVNLAKLSLWLVTLARDHAFTFVDHALRHGDSLVGLDLEQIGRFHWEQTADTPLPLFMELKDQSRSAGAVRRSLALLAEGHEDEQRELHAQSEAEQERARLLGDAVVAAFFTPVKPRDRETRRRELRGAADAWKLDDAAPEPLTLAAGALRQEEAVVPFHWAVEFPEVFSGGRKGFDAFVGNPPFLGGTMISTQLGGGYREWLYHAFPEAKGRCDLVAYFFRRAFDLLRADGCLGLIATNTIAQGDTRVGGLRWICRHGGEIYAVRTRMKWPGLAAVIVCVIHVVKGTPAGDRSLDGVEVARITAFLFHRGSHDDPARLRANAGRQFEGAKPYGQGFIFDDRDRNGVSTALAEMRRILDASPRSSEVIFPYIGGEEMNASPTHAHHRYIINLGEREEAECRERWPELMAILEERVRPERATKSKDVAAWPWWQFWRVRRDLYTAVAGLDRVLAISRVGQHGALALLPADMVYAESLIVFPLATHAAFCALQARPHEIWARFFGSSMKDDLRYTPSDCFETFPFPEGWESHPALEAAGCAYYEFRAALMVKNDEGLTKTYNRLHDPNERNPEIKRLRELHAAMDRVVLDAYGWSDIAPTCEFLLDYEEEDEESSRRRKPYRYRWPDEIRDEVLARLLELNRERAEAERLAGTKARSGKPRRLDSARGTARASRVAESLPLFGITSDDDVRVEEGDDE